MTDKEKLIKIKSLADKMYYAAFNLTTDASLLRKAMNGYRQFIIHEYHKEEPVSEYFEKIVEEIAEPTILNAYGTKELARRLRNTICGTSVSEDLEEIAKIYTLDDSIKPWRNLTKEAFIAGAKWQKEKDDEEKVLTYKHGFEDCKEQIMAKAVDVTLLNGNLIKQKHTTHPLHVGDKVKVIVIKED